MKRFLILFGFILLSAFLIVVLASRITSAPDELSLGYCPTMSGIAKEIKSNNRHLSLVQFESAGQALAAMNSGTIDIALIGRMAENSEVQNPNVKVIGSGYTLTGKNKVIFQKQELRHIRVHTYLDKPTAEQFLPESEIVYYNSIEDSLLYGINEAVLINWKDYDGEMKLIVVMDGNSKAEEFRIPVLYSLDENILNLRGV